MSDAIKKDELTAIPLFTAPVFMVDKPEFLKTAKKVAKKAVKKVAKKGKK